MEQMKNNEETRSPEREIKDVARINFGLWAGALKTGDSGEVAKLYAKDCTFLPTMSPGLLEGPEKAEEYFKHFLLIRPIGEIIKEKIQPMGDGYYSHNGLYNFEVDKKEGGEREARECRFTFNWRKDSDGKWRIIHHHSSEEPKSD